MSFSLLHNIHIVFLRYNLPFRYMPTLKVLFLGTVRRKVGEGISENLGSYKCPNITDVKTTWPASSSDFLICIRYSEYSSVIFCNSCVLQQIFPVQGTVADFFI